MFLRGVLPLQFHPTRVRLRVNIQVKAHPCWNIDSFRPSSLTAGCSEVVVQAATSPRADAHRIALIVDTGFFIVVVPLKSV